MGLYKRCECPDQNKCPHSWIISYFHEGRRKRKTIGPNKGLATTVLGKFKSQIREGKYLEVSRDKLITFEDFGQVYLEKYAMPLKASWKSDDRKCINAATPYLGKKKLVHITTQDIQDYKLIRIKTVSKVSVNKDITILSCMFNRAVEWGYLHKNPTKGVKRFKLTDEDERDRVMSIHELDAFMSAADKEIQAITLIALCTLLRKNDIQALEPTKFNFTDRTIKTIQKKTKKKITIPINDTLYSILKNRDINLPIAYNFRKKWENTVKRAIEQEKTRCVEQNKTFDPSFLHDVVFRDLRRTGATYLQDHLDVDPYVVSMLLGHNAPKVFMMTSKYAKVSEEQRYAAMQKLHVYCGLTSGRDWTRVTNLSHLPILEPNEKPQVVTPQ
jgi:integrase